MSVADIINLILSIVTIFIAGLALWQTQRQIRLSNKQQLFDRRLEKYLIVKNLVKLYGNCRFNAEEMRELPESVFIFLTNCSQLEDMATVMGNPLGQTEKENFLTKCEWLERVSEEIRLIWDNVESELFSKFIDRYSSFLKGLHKQKIAINSLQFDNEKYPMPLEIYQKKVKEFAEQNKLYKIHEMMDLDYKEIIETNAILELEKSMKLN